MRNKKDYGMELALGQLPEWQKKIHKAKELVWEVYSELARKHAQDNRSELYDVVKELEGTCLNAGFAKHLVKIKEELQDLLPMAGFDEILLIGAKEGDKDV